MFAVIFICGNLFLRIAGKIAKLITRKKFRAPRYTTFVIASHADVLRVSLDVNVSVGGYVLVCFCKDPDPRFRHAAFNRFILSHFLSQQSNLLQCVCILSDKPYFFPYSLFLIIFSIEGNSSTCISHRTVNTHSIRKPSNQSCVPYLI